VGINTAIFSRSGGSQGIGFAIPANLAHGILDELVTQGRVIRGWLGIEAQELSRELAASFGLRTPQVMIVAGVVKGGPAASAGLQPGDVLLALGGKPILDARTTMSDIAELTPGDTIPLTIVRSGEKKRVELTVGERPAPTQPGQQQQDRQPQDSQQQKQTSRQTSIR
jgi:serine protease DegS